VRYRGIAFAGKMGSGKSTATDHLVDHHGASAYSLGYYVRQYLIEELDMDPEEVFAKPTPDHVRDKLQEVGHGMREDDPDYWLRQLMDDIELECEEDEFIVVDDVRYDNESHALAKAGFFVVHLSTLDDDREQHGADHPSDDGLSDDGWVDYYISSFLGDTEYICNSMDYIMEDFFL
jgi:hypothetical protein